MSDTVSRAMAEKLVHQAFNLADECVRTMGGLLAVDGDSGELHTALLNRLAEVAENFTDLRAKAIMTLRRDT